MTQSKNNNLLKCIEEYTSEDLALYGLEGWKDIILMALNKLKQISEEYNVGINVDDIKEKYASLRIYVSLDKDFEGDKSLVWEKVHQITEEAEETSEHVCERCGKLGELREGQWLVTLCDDCYLEENEKYAITNIEAYIRFQKNKQKRILEKIKSQFEWWERDISKFNNKEREILISECYFYIDILKFIHTSESRVLIWKIRKFMKEMN